MHLVFLIGFQRHLKRRNRARRSRRRRKQSPRSLLRSLLQHLQLQAKGARSLLPLKQPRPPRRTRRLPLTVQGQSRPGSPRRRRVKVRPSPRNQARRLRSPRLLSLQVPSTSQERYESQSPTSLFPRSSHNKRTVHRRAGPPPESHRRQLPHLHAPVTPNPDLLIRRLRRRPHPPCRRHRTTR